MVEFFSLVDKFEDELKKLGSSRSELGYHSSRKGVASMIAGGCAVSPPIISLCMRAGWSVGGVKECYLKCESAGDQCVGRCACGLNPLSVDFAISPPYFDFSDLNDTTEELEKCKAMENWLDSELTNFEYNT